jgi:hypothetical protein
MKYGDFSSLVQLGVGLHVGTALLQLYGDLGLQPLARKIERIRTIFIDHPPTGDLQDQFHRLEGDFDIFKIDLFKEYKKYIIFNSAVAVILMFMLVLIAFKADDQITLGGTIPFVAGSILPALISLGCLWRDASNAMRPLNERAEALEAKVLGEN